MAGLYSGQRNDDSKDIPSHREVPHLSLARQPRIVFVSGPTATGKSEFAIKMCEKFGGEIVNADSIQFYAGLDIGSAKPTDADFKRAHHHLFSVKGVGETINASEYRKLFLTTIKERSRFADTFFVVGGSGFYLKGVLHGHFDTPTPTQEIRLQVNVWLKQIGALAAFEWLTNLDPLFASKISANDIYRIGRARENYLMTGQTPSQIRDSFRSTPIGYRHTLICLFQNRDEHKQSVSHRTQQMLRLGLIEETSSLLKVSPAGWAPLRSVGYKQCADFLQNSESKDTLGEKINQATHNLIKRQLTWFRAQPEAIWFETNHSNNAAQNWLSEFLCKPAYST